MNNEEIISLTGLVIFNRGKDYYKRGLVELEEYNQIRDNNEYTFTVQGSGRKIYSVLINESERNYYCNCPYPTEKVDIPLIGPFSKTQIFCQVLIFQG